MAQSINQLEIIANELHEASEQLYEVFAKYPLNPDMDGSPVYYELAQWNRALSAKRLRELAVEDLRIYYFKAMTTWGDVNDFKHFLPRIFELLSQLPFAFDTWVVLDKLNYGGYRAWPHNEIGALRRFLTAFWQRILVEDSDPVEAAFDNCFLALANVYPDFNQLLGLWADTNSQQAGQRLAAFVCANEKKLKKQVLPGYHDLANQGKLFFKWLRSPAVLQKLKQTVPSESRPYLDLELIPIIKQLEQQL